MDASRFDSVSRYLSQRMNRRQASLGAAAAGTAAAIGLAVSPGISAQTATPSTDITNPDKVLKPLTGSTLFVQSFESGNVVPGAAAQEFTVYLERGLGQTIYFSDRPNRLVGTLPTEEFLAKLGFVPDNPPNAAIVVDQEDGESVFAVVELFNPSYDVDTANLTYEVKVLDDWASAGGMQLQHDPADLHGKAASFTSAHLLIDGILDCPDASMECLANGEVVGTIDDHDGYCYSWSNFACLPCQPWGVDPSYFSDLCNERFDACEGDCGLWNFCSQDAPLGNTLCANSDAASNFGN